MTQYETAVEMDIGSLQRRVASLERMMTEKQKRRYSDALSAVPSH
jgi:hypothetical protein